jgi:acrylyl-CoA reductase (NADPH)
MKALVITKPETGYKAEVSTFNAADLMEGDVTFAVSHSTINYKDGLAITGKSPVVRRFPMIAGIDGAGVVESSTSPLFKAGDKVILNGWGCGETHLGSYAAKARVKGEWLVPLPTGLTTSDAMSIGTAGYTAMLCIMALERAGINPQSGSVLVTGAAGGVGSIAISLLATLGYNVIAATGRESESDYLKSLGASEVIARDSLNAPAKPLMKERWAAAIDSVGSHTLANVIAQTQYGGAVAACGLAQGMDLPSSVAPFILRGVSLLGVDSVMCPREKRLEAWARLAKTIDKAKLKAITTQIAFNDLIIYGEKILKGEVRGRIVVEI